MALLDPIPVSELDENEVAQNAVILRSAIEDRIETIDVSPGTVFNDLLIAPAALFHTMNQAIAAKVINSGSLIRVQEDASLVTDEEVVERVLGNFNLARRNGSKAGGQAVIVIASFTGVIPVTPSTTFEAAGRRFKPIVGFVGVESDSSVNNPEIERTITERADNTFQFTVDLVDSETGTPGNITAGTMFVITPALSAPVLESYAASDFAGGSDDETLAQVTDRLAEVLAAPGAGDRLSIKALICNTFPTVLDVGVIGTGDPEMRRGINGILGVRQPGYVDVYIRTRSSPLRTTSGKTATLIDPATGRWRMTFDRDEFPGFYRVDIRSPGDAQDNTPFEVVTADRGVDLTVIDDVDYVPPLRSDEGGFSRYQTLGVDFIDPRSSAELAAGVTGDYVVTVHHMPSIDTISDWLVNRERRPIGTHFLVRAAVPCVVSVGMRIHRSLRDAPISQSVIDTVKEKMAAVVNAIPFPGARLDASQLIHIAQSHLTGNSRVLTPIDLRGTILFPNGASLSLFNRDALVIPSRPEVGCTSRTCRFMLDPTSINIEVVNVDPTLV